MKKMRAMVEKHFCVFIIDASCVWDQTVEKAKETRSKITIDCIFAVDAYLFWLSFHIVEQCGAGVIKGAENYGDNPAKLNKKSPKVRVFPLLWTDSVHE